ncbi:MAG: AMIN domain-containing protein, partial [Xanthomonadales bacterium]|nr:AMIN domain-containing protein [Xanthomonadales bacterium]
MKTFRRLQRHLATVLIGLCALALAGTVSAASAHTLKDLSYQVLAGGKVELSLHFDAAPAQPRAFTTTKPPRIALDFANTDNAVTTRHVDIGTGATSGVSVVAANGRTRVVIDLFRMAQYRVHEQGDTLIVTIGDGSETSSTAGAFAATDPTKVAPATGPSVTNVDFRRGDHNGGQVIVDFSGTGAHADMHREGDRIVVNLGNVQLPKKLEQHLDVNDFATPVSFINTRATANGATLNIAAGGNYEVSAYQTPTQYTIEVTPKTKPKAKAPEMGANGLPKPVYTGQRVDFNFQDIPVRQVLHLIASESNLNIVVADSVQGNVTLRLKNVPWDQALDIVLRAKGLDKRMNGNVLWVAPQAEIATREEALAKARRSEQQNAPLISAFIPISYGKASDIAALLTEKSKQSSGGGSTTASASRGFLSPRGSVSYDERTNTLLVNDTAEQITEIRNLVAKLDKPVQQVLIESRIVVATDSFARELGIKFGVSGGYQDGKGNVITTSGDLGSASGLANQVLQNRINSGAGFPAVPPSLPSRLNV